MAPNTSHKTPLATGYMGVPQVLLYGSACVRCVQNQGIEMTSDEPETIFFNSKPLPPLRDGYVWGFRMWPGGRTELKQVIPNQLMSIDEALIDLSEGMYVAVSLDDARELVTRRLKGIESA